MNTDIRVDALKSLKIKSWEIKGSSFSDIIIYDADIEFNEDILNDKIAELKAAEPLRLLREQRNQLLAATDWMANSDVTMSEEWRIYRQALRDLPNTQTPSLDGNGQLTNITWPEKPQ